MTNERHVIFAGGGTGGHLYPGLAVARALIRRDPSVKPYFVGEKRMSFYFRSNPNMRIFSTKAMNICADQLHFLVQPIL